MILINENHNFSYDTENLAEIFFPYEKIKMFSHMPQNETDDKIVYTGINGSTVTVTADLCGAKHSACVQMSPDADRKNTLSVLFYRVLSEATGDTYPWGILYGVRPAKFYHSLVRKGSEEYAQKILKEKFLVSDEKISLVCDVAESENKIISLSQNNSFSLYVSIPFCPTRCSYCSFVSHSIERAAPLLGDYLSLLEKELEETGKYAAALGLRLETVYFGGGTPTTLSAQQLKRVLSAVEKNFDLSCLREYTVEAGRPDTVTAEKLNTLKAAGVGRISINPQTFQDSVLQAIGRRHTSAQTLAAYETAVKCGFDDINMDFIAGLPKDTLDSFQNSMQTALALQPSNITVHTLCLKTGAFMTANGMPDKNLAAQMVDHSRRVLSGAGYRPYYMYRQGKSVGNLENTGWCKPGRDCLYNVFMMDETHTVLAVGAGAVTRLKNPQNGKIERIYNYKYPYEYIGHFDEILRRKQKISDFYKKILNNA